MNVIARLNVQTLSTVVLIIWDTIVANFPAMMFVFLRVFVVQRFCLSKLGDVTDNISSCRNTALRLYNQIWKFNYVFNNVHISALYNAQKIHIM